MKKPKFLRLPIERFKMVDCPLCEKEEKKYYYSCYLCQGLGKIIIVKLFDTKDLQKHSCIITNEDEDDLPHNPFPLPSPDKEMEIEKEKV